MVKCVKVKVGKSDRYDKVYMDGKCTIRVPVLTGESEEAIQKAEKIRFEKLNDIACIMHQNYTSCSVKELNELFAEKNVSTLKDLIRVQLTDFYFNMLTMRTAEDILTANDLHLI
ncbi:MAG: hypothetical protein K6E36_10535 [Oscillospiraceae bacterium]|nr:hypothetical protein [Oscillospiraceae bacterium]